MVKFYYFINLFCFDYLLIIQDGCIFVWYINSTFKDTFTIMEELKEKIIEILKSHSQDMGTFDVPCVTEYDFEEVAEEIIKLIPSN